MEYDGRVRLGTGDEGLEENMGADEIDVKDMERNGDHREGKGRDLYEL